MLGSTSSTGSNTNNNSRNKSNTSNNSNTGNNGKHDYSMSTNDGSKSNKAHVSEELANS